MADFFTERLQDYASVTYASVTATINAPAGNNDAGQGRNAWAPLTGDLGDTTVTYGTPASAHPAEGTPAGDDGIGTAAPGPDHDTIAAAPGTGVPFGNAADTDGAVHIAGSGNQTLSAGPGTRGLALLSGNGRGGILDRAAPPRAHDFLAGTAVIQNVALAVDRTPLQGYAPHAAAGKASTAPSGTTLTLDDGTTIKFANVTGLAARPFG